jgi:hypothetical protein
MPACIRHLIEVTCDLMVVIIIITNHQSKPFDGGGVLAVQQLHLGS